MKRAGIACLIATTVLALPGAALANNECSTGEWNAIFKIANKTPNDFTPVVTSVGSDVADFKIAFLDAQTTGWNACFWAQSPGDDSGVSVTYRDAYGGELEFSVSYELAGPGTEAVELPNSDIPKVGFDGDDTLTISCPCVRP